MKNHRILAIRSRILDLVWIASTISPALAIKQNLWTSKTPGDF